MMKLFWLLIAILTLTGCNRKVYPTNGETIYKTGYNLKGEKMLNSKKSRIPLVQSCVFCHGKNGDAMRNVSIKFSDLSERYTDELFFRFLDKDLKSDGSVANIGVIWEMSDEDKTDLLHYLKSL